MAALDPDAASSTRSTIVRSAPNRLASHFNSSALLHSLASHEVRLVAVAARLVYAWVLTHMQFGIHHDFGDQVAHAPARHHGTLEGLALGVAQ